MNYQAIGQIGLPGLPYARAFDATGDGWGDGWVDGGGDAFDRWTGFKLTIGGETLDLVTATMMNDSTGGVTNRTLTIGGQSVSVWSMWHDRNHFCIQCRYSGPAVLSFGGYLGSDGYGVLSKSGLLGSHGGTPDPRIWWQIIPLVPTDPVDFTCTGDDPITVTCSAMTEGFALLFGWAMVDHQTVVEVLSSIVATVQDKEIRWPTYRAILTPDPLGLLGGVVWANLETKAQAWPGEIAAKTPPKQAPALLWRPTEPVLPVDAKLSLGFIRGTITSRSEAVAGRRVVCFGPSLDPVAETVSAADGSYRFDLLWLGREYLIMAMDNPAYQYNPAAADRRKPEVYS